MKIMKYILLTFALFYLNVSIWGIVYPVFPSYF